MIVYKATNTINGKIYIGKTVRTLSHAQQRHFQRAKFQYKYGCYSHFYNAMRKYGEKSFEWEILYKGNSDEEIQQKEREYIAKLNSMDRSTGYNMTPGGDGGAGGTLSAKHRERISIANKGKNNQCYGKFGEDHPAYGHKKSNKAIEAIRKAHTGKNVSKDTRERISQARLKRFAPQREARKLAEAQERERKAIIREEKRLAGAFRGENGRASKVSDAERAEICKRRALGESYKSISNDYPLGLTGVRAVVQTWGPVNGFPMKQIFAKSNHREVLTPVQRASICRRFAAGEKYQELAKEFEIGETTAYETLRTWGPANGFPYTPSRRRK
ncbi:NUMOD3 domain-containing DNA-binding protein [uncultured Pseudodesulfovibrio sp.]|uniref:NUMOD3 domain-containing DNA-binding protein n=1 Tax=uncultured Pseudodesulfovibrio sp. TaxID=2035858 RepID=UPI0029C8FE73|nr:NUMOD3 domain-containing DNA-binding protein [uncultured Pseudodesulfovibrio sp.]